jgi:hypothetical protein
MDVSLPGMASAAWTQQQLCNSTQSIMDITPQPLTAAHQKGNFLSAQNIPSSYRQPLHLPNFPPLLNEANERETVSTEKRPRFSPDKRTSKHMRTDNYWLNPPTTTSNRFETL